MSEIEETLNKKSEQAYKCSFCKNYFTKSYVKKFGLRGIESQITQFFYICNNCDDKEPPCAQ